MIPVTPRGFKDILPDEARWREYITTNVQKELAAWGYEPIETPTLEVLEVLELGGKTSEAPLRLIDSDGTLLALRPDVTLPIARMVASRLKKQVLATEQPLRFRYVQPVFREEESLRGQAREFTQIGIESIGLEGAAADAEVILLLVDALKACGIKDFTISLCTVSVLSELLDEIEKRSNTSKVWRRLVLEAFHHNNVVEVTRLAKENQIDARYTTVLEELINIRGRSEAIEQCKELVGPLKISSGLDRLEQTLSIIEGAGAGSFVTIDFSVMRAFDYYTGIVFEAYAPKLGVALGGGGRYDHMLASYGIKASAAGFAFSLDRVMMAQLEQAIELDRSVFCPEITQVLIDENNPSAAFIKAAKLRSEGKKVVFTQNTQG